MTKKDHNDQEIQGVWKNRCSHGKITSLSTFHGKPAYKALKGMLEYDRPEIFVEFCDKKKEIRFVFEKQVPNYIR